MVENNSSKFKKCALALAVASCMSLATGSAFAAGLGKLTVFSSLGQPLKAEVDLSATREELVGMTARLAAPEVFKQAGVDFAPALTDLQFKVHRRANGKPVLQLSSSRPVNEPFLDFLVELTWPSGRLVREYTFLLDPPEFAGGAGMRSSVDAKVVDTVRDVTGAPAATAAPAAARPPSVQTGADDKTRRVETGDTLFRIANERRHAGVSLEQMLVGLYRNNPDAFIEKDINRLKSGVILNIPDQASVAAISQQEARSVYVTAGDFAAYRRKLAAAAAASAQAEKPAEQSAVGKITPKVEEKLPAIDASRDQVKVARADAPSANEVDRIANEKALQESQSRILQLERNLGEMQKLLEMKNQRLAELEKGIPSPDAVQPPAPVTEPPTTTEPDPAPVEPAAANEPVAEESAPVPAQETPAPAPVVEPPKPDPVVPPEEPSLLDNPLPLAGGAAAIALLAGLLLYRRRRKPDMLAVETTAAPSPASLGPNSVFRMTGGQSVDTASTPPHTGDFSQAGPGTIDTDEVDPVAEADVYMAYGRDAQAEEILLEAMHKDPNRLAIPAKLLEIYANRRSLKQFDTLATELYAQSGGVGPEWEKVAALGAGIDPENPLYGGAAKPAAKPAVASSNFDPDATLVAGAAATAAVAAAAAAAQAKPDDELDFSATLESAPVPESATREDDLANGDVQPEISFTLPEAVADEAPAPAADDDFGLAFDLGEVAEAVEAEEKAPAALAADAGDGIAWEEEAVAAVAEDVAEAVEEIQAPEAPYVDTIVTAEVPPDALDFDLSGMVGGDSSLTAVTLDETAAVPEPEVMALEMPPLDGGDGAEPAGAAEEVETPDFSPEGTLVVSNAQGFGQDFDTDFDTDGLSFDEPLTPGEEEVSEVSGEEKALAELMSTNVNAPLDEAVVPEMPSSVGGEVDTMSMDEPDLVSTVVNPQFGEAPPEEDVDFDVKLSDSVFLGQPMMPSDFDIGSINLDLSAAPEAAAEEFAAESAAPSGAEGAADAGGEEVERGAQWEEVNTKLDLARAYEEMGDLEGARELLQEVLGEGTVDLVEQARAILARIDG